MKATAQLITVATLFAIAAVPPATARAPLSVSGYRSHANAICAQEQQKTMSRLMGSKNLAQYLAQEVPVLRSALQSFQRLDPPTTLSSLHAQVIAIVKGDITLFSTLAKQARAGQVHPATWQNNPKLLNLNVRELALWKQIGAKGCASP